MPEETSREVKECLTSQLKWYCQAWKDLSSSANLQGTKWEYIEKMMAIINFLRILENSQGKDARLSDLAEENSHDP